MSKSTPGPWEIRRKFNVFGYRQDGAILSVVATTGGHQSNIYEVDAENTANANLIAAAPDLLEALEIISGTGPIMGWLNDISPEVADDIKAAIAKARGES